MIEYIQYCCIYVLTVVKYHTYIWYDQRRKPNTRTETLSGAVRIGRGGKEKEWTDCVQSDIRAFGITGHWKTMALKAEVWVKAVTEGGRRFVAAWREE